MVFDIPISTKEGVVFATCFRREIGAAGISDVKITMSYKEAHDILGHLGEEATKATAKFIGWIITGDVPACEACAVGKAKQKAVPQVTSIEPLQMGDRRVHLDISTLKPRPGDEEKSGAIAKSNWRLIVDAITKKKYSGFFKTKDEMIEPTCMLFKRWKDEGRPVTHLRMDNAGENVKLKFRCESADWKLGIKHFEFTSRDTPQQNSLVEVGFATLGNRARAMMFRANVPAEYRSKLFAKALMTANQLDDLVLETINGKTLTRVEHDTGKLPGYVKNLRTWGEAGVVKLKTKTTPKMLNKGVTCMFIGYAEDHPHDCFLMWNAKTNGVHTSRDIVWLRRMYFSKQADKAIFLPI